MDANVYRFRPVRPPSESYRREGFLDWSSSHRRGFLQHGKRADTEFGQHRPRLHRGNDGPFGVCPGGLFIVEEIDAAAAGFCLIEKPNFPTESRHLRDLGSNRVESDLKFRATHRKLVGDLQEMWHPRTFLATSDCRKQRLPFFVRANHHTIACLSRRSVAVTQSKIEEL
jgi:hypothetical protein